MIARPRLYMLLLRKGHVKLAADLHETYDKVRPLPIQNRRLERRSGVYRLCRGVPDSRERTAWAARPRAGCDVGVRLDISVP